MLDYFKKCLGALFTAYVQSGFNYNSLNLEHINLGLCVVCTVLQTEKLRQFVINDIISQRERDTM